MVRYTEHTIAGVVAGVCLIMATQSHAQSPSYNLLTDPSFTGQSANFQSTSGSYASGWTYTPGYDFFANNGDLVSQSISTANLYYYDITFNLGISPTEGNVDFALFWDGTPINVTTTSSPGWNEYSFQVTADSSSSQVGLVGNTAFWSSLYNLDTYWTGGVDPPPSPEGSIGFVFEAVLLLGLCAAGRMFHSRKLS